MPLNDRQIRNAKPTEAGKKAKLFDGGGLYLEVTPVITTERKRKTKDLRRRLKTAISNVTENENKIAAEGIRENARKAGQAKQSPYEKAGTTAAVNKLLEEKKKMLDKRGGKAELTRLIIRKIENDEINAPDIPTEKTVMKWIANFQKQEVNMLTS